MAELVERIDQTPRVRTLVLNVPGWEGHRAGQHVDIRLTAEDGYQAERSYSIASAPEDSYVALTVERIGDGEVSPYLVDELMVGEQVEVRGPVGGYFVWEASRDGPLFLAAGGSGVVPLMAMIRHRAAAGSKTPCRLLFSSRSVDEIIYRDELSKLAGAGDGFEVFHTLTRAQPPGWTGGARRVDRNMIEQVAWAAGQHPLSYVCGPTSFVESVAGILDEMGHSHERIRTERFGPTGT